MARVGINPARGQVSSYRPARVTVVMITYIPDLSGYFEQRLQVLQLVIASLQQHTKLPHDVMVFDNGSCSQVVDYLQDLHQAGQIDYLLLSQQNIGKIGAFRIAFSAAPGEIVAYNDDDVFFYPDWLEAHLDVLESFSTAGLVSGLPVRDAARHAHRSLDELVAQGAPGISITRQRRIPDEWEADWAVSTGRDPQAHLQATQDHLDLVLEIANSNGSGSVEAIGSANHFQFVAYKRVLLQALPVQWSGKLMGQMVEFDEAVDSLGYLRLSTTQRYTRHIGNLLSPAILQEAQDLDLQTPSSPGFAQRHGAAAKKHWLLRIPGARHILVATYKRLFDVLYR